MDAKKYPEEPLKTWKRVKEVRQKLYESYARAHEIGGLRIGGSTITWTAPLQAFGRDVFFLGGEPYAAGISFFADFAARCQQACERENIARDLCGYMRNYLGGMLLNQYVLPDRTIVPWPKADLHVTAHLCCSHAKWYQYASDLEANTPLFVMDWPCGGGRPLLKEELDYLTTQLLNCIEWIEKLTGRKFDDELFIEAALNEVDSSIAWAEAYLQNQAIPAPIDERRLYSYFSFGFSCPQWKEVVDLYRELRDELKDRVVRGIAACGTERYRIMTEGAPTWGALDIFKYVQKEYGAVPICSWYTAYWGGVWDRDKEGNLIPPSPLLKEDLLSGSREERLRKYIRWKMEKQDAYNLFVNAPLKSESLKKIAKQWKVNGVFMHLNRGCEGNGLAILQYKQELQKEGIPVLAYEGNMGDAREFDYSRTLAKVDTFLENQGLRKLQ